MEKIYTKNAPDAIGPYSQAVKVGNLVFTSGQIAINPASGAVEATDIKGQTEQVCKNLCAVLEAAGTKWNFLKFYPGLVGGHCIGVDPYYLTYRAEQVGYHSQVILSGRRINDDMGKYVAENIVKNLIKAGKTVKNARVAILGFTFKENCPDTRNTKIFDIVKELREYGIEATIADPIADSEEAKHLYGVEFVDINSVVDMDAVVLAVAHDEFSKFSIEDMDKLFGKGKKVLLDIKGLLNKKEYDSAGYLYWRL